MKSRLALIVIGLALSSLAYGQPGTTKEGVYYGLASAKPSSPFPGQLFVTHSDTGDPVFEYYRQISQDWAKFAYLSALTDNTIPVYDSTTGELEDSLLTDDGTNISLSSGQFLLPDGAVATPAWGFTSEVNTGGYTTGSNIMFAVDGVLEFTFANDLFTIAGAGAAATPAIILGGDVDTGPYSIGANNFGLSVGGVLVQDWEDTNAAGASADLTTISFAPGIMNGSDTVRGKRTSIANVNHTGTGNTLVADDIDAITGDAHATEIGRRVGAGFDIAAQYDGVTSQTAYRQDFDGPCQRVAIADFTVEDVGDGNENYAICGGDISHFVYRLDGAQTSPFKSTGGGLVYGDAAANNEGVDAAISDLIASDSGWVLVGTSVAKFVRFNVTIASVSGTDNAYFGWREVGAFIDDLVLETYDTYGAYHLSDNAGNLEIQTGDDGTDADDEEDQVADWGDGETHTVEVRVSTAGVFSFYIDDLPSTITQATGAAAAGEILVPFFGFLSDTDADTAMVINWIEIGEVH